MTARKILVVVSESAEKIRGKQPRISGQDGDSKANPGRKGRKGANAFKAWGNSDLNLEEGKRSEPVSFGKEGDNA